MLRLHRFLSLQPGLPLLRRRAGRGWLAAIHTAPAFPYPLLRREGKVVFQGSKELRSAPLVLLGHETCHPVCEYHHLFTMAYEEEGAGTVSRGVRFWDTPSRVRTPARLRIAVVFGMSAKAQDRGTTGVISGECAPVQDRS